MTHIHDLIAPALLAEMIDGRYINRQQHPDGELTIWNYAQRAQFDNAWNDATTTCRGLITTTGGDVVARPFRKFFNLGQLDAMPDGPFTASQKMDGSLGIIYQAPDGGPAVATRGSFTSDQATWATAWLRARNDHYTAAWNAIAQGRTLLVEIIYPGNRIVVDYGDRQELVYLATIDNATGADVLGDYGWPGSRAERFNGYDLNAIMSMEEPNTEGFVLQWPDGTRAKVKFAEYLRLHKLLTGVNARTIWELLATDQPLADLLEVVPDEFFDWVTATAEELHERFHDIMDEALHALGHVDRSAARRDQAAVISVSKYPGIVFALLDDKNPSEKIWRLIKPEATRPFVQDADA